MELKNFDKLDRILVLDDENAIFLNKSIKQYEKQINSVRKVRGGVKQESRMHTKPVPLLEKKDGKTITFVFSHVDYKKLEVSLRYYDKKLETARNAYVRKNSDKPFKPRIQPFKPIVDLTIEDYLKTVTN